MAGALPAAVRDGGGLAGLAHPSPPCAADGALPVPAGDGARAAALSGGLGGPGAPAGRCGADGVSTGGPCGGAPLGPATRGLAWQPASLLLGPLGRTLPAPMSSCLIILAAFPCMLALLVRRPRLWSGLPSPGDCPRLPTPPSRRAWTSGRRPVASRSGGSLAVAPSGCPTSGFRSAPRRAEAPAPAPPAAPGACGLFH